MNILLIDTRVSDSQVIVAAIDPALSLGITFDYYTDTFDTLKDRIVLAIREHSGGADATLANSVGLVQHSYKMSTFKIVDAQTTSSIIEQVETQDKELSTWAPLKEFISWCKTELSSAHFDMMACSLYSNPDWKYVIDMLSTQTGVEIRASTDDTGSATLGGNWFLESHVGVNLKEVYFNDSIDGYKGLLLSDGIFKYTLNGNNATVTQYTGSYGNYTLEFPEQVGYYLDVHYVITAIADYFIWPGYLGGFSFNINSKLVSIGIEAFAYMTLGTLYSPFGAKTFFPPTLTSIGSRAFYQTSVTIYGGDRDIILPINVNSIGYDAFNGFNGGSIYVKPILTWSSQLITPSAVGSTFYYTANKSFVTYNSTAIYSYRSITYASTDPTVATIDSSTGFVTVLKTGTVAFTASLISENTGSRQGNFTFSSADTITSATLTAGKPARPWSLIPVTLSKMYGTTAGPISIPTLDVQVKGSQLQGFPLLSTLSTWTIEIGFTATSSVTATGNGWRALLGSMYYSSPYVRGWGIWVSNQNYIYYSQSVNSFSTGLSVSVGVAYNLNITKDVNNKITFLLGRISGGNVMIYDGTTVTDTIGNGPVSIGGWPLIRTEDFPGTISYVEVKNYFSIGGKTFQVTAPENSDTAITYSNPTDTSVASINTTTGLITITNNKAGTVVFSATQPETTDYRAETVTVTLNVLKVTPIITIPNLPTNKTTMDNTFTFPISTIGDGTVTFNSSATSVATIDNSGLVTTKGIFGATNITVSQAASINYNKADDVVASLWINVGTPSLSSVTISKTLGTTVGPVVSTISGSIVNKKLNVQTNGFPVLNDLLNWTIEIGFTQTTQGSWRALLGSMYYDTTNLYKRGWGIWVSDVDEIYYSQSDVNKTFSTGLKVSPNVAYNLNVAKTGTVGTAASTVTFTLTNISTGESLPPKNFNLTDTIGTGPVSIGGWPLITAEDFQGTISYVEVKNYFSMGGKTFQVTAPAGSSRSDGAMSYGYPSGDTGVAGITSTGLITITNTKAGTVVFPATQAGTTNYNSATSTVTLTVLKVTPILTIFPNLSKTFGDTNFTITAPTSSIVGTFTYTSSNENVAIISGNTIQIVGANVGNSNGFCTITATQAGTDIYNAVSISATLSVTKGTPVLSTFTISSKTTIDKTVTFTPPTSSIIGPLYFSSENLDVATIDSSTGVITIKGIVGTAKINVLQKGTTNYNDSNTVSATLIVSKGTPTLTNFPNLSKTFGTSPFSVTPPTSENETVGTFRYISSDQSVATIDNSSGLVTILKVGSTDISVSQVETTNFFVPVNPIIATLNVTKGTPVLSTSFTISSKTTIDKTVTFTPPTSSIIGPLYFSSENLDVATIDSSTGVITIKGIVGTAKINVLQKGTTNYNDSNTVSATLIVSKGTPTLTNFPNLSKTFGTSPFSVTPPTSENETVGTFRYISSDQSVATIDNSSGLVTILKVGSTDISVSQVETTNFFVPVNPIIATLNVTKGTPTITITNLPATKTILDTTPFSIGYTTPSDGTLTFSSNNSNVASIDASGNITIKGIAGSSIFTVSQAPSSNYNEANATATLTVINLTTLVNTNVSNVDLSGQNLNGVNFSGATITGTNFTNASIVGATNLPTTFSTKQKLQLLCNANNAAAASTIPQLQFSGPLSVSEFNTALSVSASIPELSSVKTEFFVAAPVYVNGLNGIKTVTITSSSISASNNTSLYIPLNKGDTVKINGISYTLNALSNQLEDSSISNVALKLIVVNGYPFKIYISDIAGSIIAVNITNILNNITFDAANTIKLYDVVNSIILDAIDNPTLDATVTNPVYNSFASNTNTFTYNLTITGPTNPFSLDKTKYRFIIESVNNSTLSRTTISQPTWSSITSPLTVAFALLTPLTSYSIIVTPTLFDLTSNLNLKSLLPVKTLTFTTLDLSYGDISSVTFTKNASNQWYFNFQYSGFASLTSFIVKLTWSGLGYYGGLITQDFSSYTIAYGTNNYLITADTNNYLAGGRGPSLIANVVTATINYFKGNDTKQEVIAKFVPNPLVGAPFVLGISSSSFNTDVVPATCTATIPTQLEQQRVTAGRGWYYDVTFVEKETGNATYIYTFYASGSVQSNFTISPIPLSFVGKTFTSQVNIRNDGTFSTSDYVVQNNTSNTNYFTIPTPTGIFPTEVTALDHKGMFWYIGEPINDVRLFKVTWLTTPAGLSVTSSNYVSKVRISIKQSGDSTYKFIGVYNYADGVGYSMFHTNVRTSQGNPINTWLVDIRSENANGTIYSVTSSYSLYGSVAYSSYDTLASLATFAGSSTILYGDNIASTFAVSNLALSGGYNWNSSTQKYATSVAFKTSIPFGASTITYQHKLELVNPDTTKSTLGSFSLDNSTKTLAVSSLNPSSSYTIKVTLVDSTGNDVTGFMASSQTLTLTVPAAQ